MPYGYLGQNTPNQTVSNSGVFSISDVASLEKQGKFGGSLELIREETVSGVSSTNFTSIQENIYNVHFLTVSFTETTVDTLFQLSNNGGTSYITTGYQYGVQYGSVSGTASEDRSTNSSNLFSLGGSSAGNSKFCYTYFYNLGDSSKYSFTTTHFFGEHPTFINYYKFGGGVYPTAETHNAIRLFTTGTMTGTAKLYGVKQL